MAKKKNKAKSRWNLIHERWEIFENKKWLPHPERSASRKWLRVETFVDAWQHELKKDLSKRSIATLAKKFRVSSSEVKKQRTMINNAVKEHYPDRPGVALAELPDLTKQQQTTYRSQSNELSKDNLAKLFGIELFIT